MQGIKPRTSKLFYQFSLEDHISADHPLRRIDHVLDLRFLYKQTRPYYGSQGQKSIDPVVFFKICLVGYFNNLTGDRALIRFCNDSLSARWFIGYDIDQALPVHSTLSRTRSLFGEDIYEQVFSEILGLCVNAGLVQGDRQVVDSALVKANAHIGSMQRKQILEDASEYCRQVIRENKDDALPCPGPALEAVALPSKTKDSKDKSSKNNDTHQCSSDPDARMGFKPNKPKDMYYHGQVCVDSQHGVVTAAMGDYGDRNDHYSFAELLAKARENLAGYGLSINEVLADTGYTTGENIRWCEQADMTAYMPNPSNYTPERPGFTYNEQADRYECSQGEYLTYRSTTINKKRKKRNYRTSTKQCKNCPIIQQCITSKSTFKQLAHSPGKPWYDLMARRLSSSYGKWLLRKRKAIVEPALGNLLHNNAMKKVYARGIQAANKHVMMASMSMNLKKWLKHSTKPPKVKAHRAISTPWSHDVLDFKQIYSFVETILAHQVQKLSPQSMNLANPLFSDL
ncbi:MAG: IS1182 family transposase [Balneolaceae bacterium]|nr:IS1182 family transposase [Balneolaceae bacterium]